MKHIDYEELPKFLQKRIIDLAINLNVETEDVYKFLLDHNPDEILNLKVSDFKKLKILIQS